MIKYKRYFRKTSLKQKGHGDFLLDEVKKEKPKIFLEIGVFHGVTARNVCELLYQINKDDFKYIGLDLFEENNENINEVIPNNTFTNPFKNIYFKYIKKQNPYSLVSVKDLLGKFEENVHLIKGNSNKILKKINMSKIDYVFLDGGHEYNTVRNDLENCIDVINKGGTVLCDDYSLVTTPDVKKAVDEFIKENQYNVEILCDNRFAKIQK